MTMGVLMNCQWMRTRWLRVEGLGIGFLIQGDRGRVGRLLQVVLLVVDEGKGSA